MKSTLFLILVFIAVFQGCKTPGTLSSGTVHSSHNSPDWGGVYKGVLPCADCEGIRTALRLKSDNTYELVNEYIGKDSEPFKASGSFTWDRSGRKITLDESINGSWKQSYQVGENALVSLDMKGKIIEGPLADNYILRKEKDVITERYWKLTHLGGREISFLPGQPREAFFMLKEKDNRINGNGGCNTFFGTYTLSEGSRIRFSELASTMMACPGLNTERQFLDVFETADNYSLNGDTLTLNKARMAPLARFVAVWFR
jgi:heat shock protein HslJ